MVTAVSNQSTLRKVEHNSKLIESHCSACGAFLAASSVVKFLELVEKLHQCPASTWNEARRRTASGDAHLFSYLREAGEVQLDADLMERLQQLLQQLLGRDQSLRAWLQLSDANAAFFRKDPIAAIRTAKLGIEESLLRELESISSTITRLRAIQGQ